MAKDAPGLHRVTHTTAAAGYADLVRHMDQLLTQGWEPFQVMQSYVGGIPSYVVLSRRERSAGTVLGLKDGAPPQR